MKGFKFYLMVAVICMAATAMLYLVHYLIYRDIHFIFLYLLFNIAYLPLEVFLVVIVIERILARREKQSMLHKLNMTIGAFFSEIGNHILADLIRYFDNHEEISHNLNVTANWTIKDFKRADTFAYHLKIDLDIRKVDLAKLKEFLSRRRTHLLTLLGNPNLLEHDRFTDLLWATTHLDEELEAGLHFRTCRKRIWTTWRLISSGCTTTSPANGWTMSNT